ncbi:hypothetical protein QYS60_02545 [Rhodococcus sp. GXMU-t2271]|uniref:lipopolysaccharide biosynthesis protein n=1 Tax=Rhodococcus sp. GXMU-t2271 TaxID=3059079 RepID=UPI00352B4503
MKTALHKAASMNNRRPNDPRKSGGVRNLAATIIAFAPGLALPFVITAEMSTMAAAAILLAFSAATAVSGTVGNAIELNAVAEFGKLFSRTLRPTGRNVTRFVIQSVRFSLIAASLIVPASVILVMGRFEDPKLLVAAGVGLLPLPLLYAVSNTLSGAVIAAGRTPTAILTQALRTLPPLLFVIAIPIENLLVLALSFTIGEALRGFVLVVSIRRTSEFIDTEVRDTVLTTKGMGWQSSATFLAQFGPMVNRAFLVGAGPSAIVAYELADKLNAAGNQFMTSGVLLPRFSSWSRLQIDNRRAWGTVTRDAMKAALISAAIAVVGSVGGFLAPLIFPIPNEWIAGVRWGALLFLGLPAVFVTTACNRLFILLGRQRLLMPLMLTGLATTVGLNFVFTAIVGPFGVIVALIVARYALAGIHVAVIARVAVPKTWSLENKSLGPLEDHGNDRPAGTDHTTSTPYQRNQRADNR